MGGRSVSSTAVLLAAALATPGYAEISNVSPGDGDVVTVDTAAPNPDPRSISATGNANITVNVLSGAMIDHSGPFAVGLGSNGVVNNAGTISADADAIQLSDGGQISNFGTITTLGANALNLTGDVDVTNRGTITGASRSILFNGTNDNRLTLEPGSNLTAFVDAGAGTDTFTLGGATGSASFNLDDIDAAGTYRGFEVFTKEGDSTWNLTGTGDQSWTVSSGTLQIDGTLTGSTTLDGGTLRVNATANLGTNTISVGGGGGTLESTNNEITLTNDIALSGDLITTGDQTLRLQGDITGTGGLTKNGTRNLFLTGNNTFDGDIAINDFSLVAAGGDAVPDGAVVRISEAATFETFSRETFGGLAGAGRVVFNGQTIILDVDAADELTHSGTLQASSAATDVLLKTGVGTQTLAGSGPGGLALQLTRAR